MFNTSLRARAARWSIVTAIAGGAVMLAAAKPLVSASASMFGGPWISIESPVNPYDASTRGALMLVHTFRHGSPMDMGMAGRAEGLIDGQRRSVALELRKASNAGTYAVSKQWESKGVWTLVITASPTDHGPGEQIQAVVEVSGDGDVGKVSVPRTAQGALRTVAAAEIDRGLRERAKAPMAVGAR